MDVCSTKVVTSDIIFSSPYSFPDIVNLLFPGFVFSEEQRRYKFDAGFKLIDD